MLLHRVWNWCQACWQFLFPPKSLGERGEAAAEALLRRKGYRIVARRDRGRYGEIDLIAVDTETIVFVEVKTRSSDKAGDPTQAVDEDKQLRLSRLALTFLRQHDLLEYPARFDVVAVTWPKDDSRPSIQHIPSAFDAVGKWQMFR